MSEIDRLYKANVSQRLLEHMKVYSKAWPEISSNMQFKIKIYYKKNVQKCYTIKKN